MLFSMGGLFSIYEGNHKLQETEPLNSPLIAIGVLIFAIIAEGISLAACMREVNKVRKGRSYLQWFRETRQSELMVIFGEDVAALLGLVFALIAVTLSMVTGNPIYDAMGSIMIGVLLLIIAVMIGREVKALIIGQGVEPAREKEMLDFLHGMESIEKVFNLLTLQLGSSVMVAVKAKMIAQNSDTDLINAINDVEKNFRAEFPEVQWCFFEPDLHD